MDPDHTLVRILELGRALAQGAITEGEALELAELIAALHGWIIRGGFLPAAWTHAHGGKPLTELNPKALSARLDALCDMVRAVSAEIARRTWGLAGRVEGRNG